MSGQRTRPSVPAEHRSAHPNIPGVPWWGAVLIAVVAALLGVAFDAGSGAGELTSVFAALFVIGCVAAVLTVRQSGLFTAVIQPPLLLFVVVPGAYFLMHGDSIEGIKDVLINCGYPLIERFPLMFFTSAAVLLIGLGRWYFGATHRGAGDSSAASAASEESGTAATGGRIPAMLAALLGGRAVASAAGPETAGAAPRGRAKSPRRRAAKPAPERAGRGERPQRRAAGSSRRPRPDETEVLDAVGDRPRRRRPRPEDAPPAQPRRRAKGAPAREPRRAADRRAAYDRAERPDRERAPRPQQRRPRYEGFEGYQTFGGYDGIGGMGGYEGYEPPREPRRERGNGTHHPVSRVRYRGGEDGDDRAEYRTRRRDPRDSAADRWEYDI